MNNCKHIGFEVRHHKKCLRPITLHQMWSDLEIPTTQVIKRDLLITQDHENYPQELRDEP